jgi:acetyl esterase/lipase
MKFLNFRFLLVAFALSAVLSELACAEQPPSTAEPPKDSAEAPKVLLNLPYVENGHPQQKLDLYLPAHPKGPLLVWIHGGGWVGGTKDKPPGLAMVNGGIAVASVEYRFSQHAIFPAQIEDCKAALRWLRAHDKD